MEKIITDSGLFFLLGCFTVCLIWFLSKRVKKAVVKTCSYIAAKGDLEKRLADLELHAREILEECIQLLIRKQRDYGRENIAKFGEEGVIIRLNDKQERLNQLVLKHKKPANESIEDTYYDKINYSMIALLIRRGLW